MSEPSRPGGEVTASAPAPPSAGPADAPVPAEATDARGRALQAAPPLAVLAAIAAVLDLAINRVGARAFAELTDDELLRSWMRFGVLPRNVAAVAGLVALLASLVSYLRMPGFAPLYLRLPIAGFAGILLPPLVLATVLPRERLSLHLVLFGMFAAYVLAVLFGLAAVGYRRIRALRVAVGLALATALQALLVVTLASVRALVSLGFGGKLGYLARHGGEIAWLLAPLAVLPALRPARWGPRERAALGLGALVAAAILAAGVAAEAKLHPFYSIVMYGAFRVDLLPEQAALAYAVHAAVVLGVSVAALAGPDPWGRQLGAAMMLWLAGGYAARSPIQLLDSVLAVILLARAAQSADPEGLRRAAQRWFTAEATPEGERPPAEPAAEPEAAASDAPQAVAVAAPAAPDEETPAEPGPSEAPPSA